MSHRTRLVLLALGSLVILAGPGFASHPEGTEEEAPSYVDEGLALTAAGSLTGLNEADVHITVRASAEVRGTCRSPEGGEIEVRFFAEARSIATGYHSDGSVRYAVTTVAPESPVPGAPDCPDETWEQTVEEVLFRGATITAEQFGLVVYERTDTL